MKILTAEIGLRDETRVAEQAKAQTENDAFKKLATSLAETQEELGVRVETVIEQIEELPDGASQFGKEINQLTNAGKAMWDASDILLQPNTSAPAIAAETDAIEWLLRAKRSKGGGGGGGGSTPGGGSREGADSNIAALALIGESKDESSTVEHRVASQTTGKSGKELPEEFQRGLDKYFELLEEER